MEPITQPAGADERPIFEDGFGTRSLAIDQETGEAVEVLSFVPRLIESAGFAEAVGERVARLARNRHMSYARARRIERPSEDSLWLVSDRVAGWRLTDVLRYTAGERQPLDISAVIALMRHLIPAAALFSRQQRDACNGVIAPERLILTPSGRLVIADYVLGPAVERLQFSRERLWRELRVVLPPTASTTKFPPAADVVAMGVVALSLVLGRILREDEFLVSLGELVDTAHEHSGGVARPLAAGFKDWLSRALQFEERTALDTPHEAQVAFEEMLAKERAYVTSTAPLETFIAALQGSLGAPAQPPAPAASAPDTQKIGDTIAESPRRTDSGSHRVSVPSADAAEAAVAVEGVPEPPPATPVTDALAAAETLAGTAVAEPASPAPAVVVDAAAARGRGWGLIAALAAVALIEAGVIGWMLTAGEAPALVTTGELVVQSQPVAARVTIDGEERGITPFNAELSPGAHILEVRVGRSEPRVIPVLIRAGVQSGIYVELQSVATVGALDVRSDPARARVTVDGQVRGNAPLVIRDLPPGDHEVVVEAGGRQVKQTVRVEAGITSQLVVPLGTR
jgi:hypothetical protein